MVKVNGHKAVSPLLSNRSIVFACWRQCDPCNSNTLAYTSLLPTGISIGSSVFARLTNEPNTHSYTGTQITEHATSVAIARICGTYAMRPNNAKLPVVRQSKLRINIYVARLHIHATFINAVVPRLLDRPNAGASRKLCTGINSQEGRISARIGDPLHINFSRAHS